jgi:hypothetical protein
MDVGITSRYRSTITYRYVHSIRDTNVALGLLRLTDGPCIQCGFQRSLGVCHAANLKHFLAGVSLFLVYYM